MLITGRAAKLVCPVLDSSVKEESFDQACSCTGEISWSVLACDGEFTLDPLFAFRVRIDDQKKKMCLQSTARGVQKTADGP